jgi:glyoxylase I family protein
MAQSQHAPIRLHHNAYVTRDQEKTRQFYEEVIGMPLVATWCESDELFGKVRTYCHTFYSMADGGALAFFQFENPEDQEQFGPKMPASPFHHIALAVDAETQAVIEKRIGYCRSVYVTDPNGLILEFTLDHPEADKISQTRRADAHQELKRWLAGNHTSNNTYR